MWQILDESRAEHAGRREQLQELLDEDEFAAARRTALNAHYTDAGYVAQVWRAVQRLGFKGGEVLEPGCGAGTFIGMAPHGAHLTGVELDPTTAAIAQALYPEATIRAESFARTRYPEGHFDAVVGNVPFSDVTLHDPIHNRAGHSMHNHFILKSLELTRPGGVVALLTSRHTLDSRDPAARRDMNKLGDLIGAVRLPSGAHTRAAGTEVVTDLLIFRRREPGQQPASVDWETTVPVTLNGPNGPEQVGINSRYVVDADQGILSAAVLGAPVVRVGMYGAAGLEIDPNPSSTVSEQLAVAVDAAVDAAIGAGHSYQHADRDPDIPQLTPAAEGELEGHITAHSDGSFTMVSQGLHEPLAVPSTQAAETRALLELRDLAVELLDHEAASFDDSAELANARQHLAATWQAYVTRYGPLNRCKVQTRTRTADDGTVREFETRTYAPAVTRVTRRDPLGALVTALELYDEEDGTAAPAGLLRERQVVPRQPITQVETPEDAIAVSLDQTGGVDLKLIAELRQLPVDQALAELDGRVLPDPAVSAGNEPTEWIYRTRAEYLSGDVREKLRAATAAADSDERWKRNVAELRAVLPADLGPGDLVANFGAVWIPPSDITAFMRDVLGDRYAEVSYVNGVWIFEDTNRYSTAAVSDYGTERMPAPDLIRLMCEQKAVLVYDTIDDRRVPNPVETDAAQEKAHQLTERLNEWLWEDPERAERLVTDYNNRFNAHVLRDYSAEGAKLSLPGLAKGHITPRAHQRAAVARMLAEPSVGLFHAVGAGKTAEMVMGMTELKRLGLVNKPAMVVPNHMLEQVAREWLQLYPQARILTLAASDISAIDRRRFLARVAANDWDGIVFTQTAFEKIPLSKDAIDSYQAERIEKEISAVQQALDAATGRSAKLKRIERRLLADQEKLAAHTADRDPGITFEQTGIDYLVVDEIHLYKNLRTVSSIQDAQIDGSKRATDLDSKLHYLRSRNGARVMCGATATPIANSVTELYVMQRYHNPEGLERAGIDSFDRWAATFGEVVTGLEMNITGTQFKVKSRFAKFQNTPELIGMLHNYADIKTADDLSLPVPAIATNSTGDRAPQVLTVPRSPELAAYIADLDERVNRVQNRQVDPSEDNMLKVASDGRKAALDMQLVDPELTHAVISTPQKVHLAAHKIAQVWAEHADDTFHNAEGEPSPIRGALQIVFCDQSTPSTDGDRWNVYDALREALHERGLPDGSVRFIHEARTPQDKARLFAECRSGRVAVLIGSTEKMGVGTNIQARAVHLLDMDAPWRPADLEQRHGRIVRQGNQNHEVELTQLVTEGSFDAYMWQTLERKSRFINQIMSGRLDSREMEDIAAETLTFAQFKAIATGNPLIMKETEARATLARLQRLETAHDRNQAQLRRRVDQLTSSVASVNQRIASLQRAVEQTQPTAGDAFTMTINRRTYTKRAEAANALDDAIARAPWGATITVATCGGHDITITQAGSDSALAIADTGQTISAHPAAETSTIGRITRIENLISGLPAALERSRVTLADHTSNLQRAQASVGQPFQHSEALAAAHQQHAVIAAKLAAHLGQDTISTTPDDSTSTRLAAIRHKVAALSDLGAQPEAHERPHHVAAPETAVITPEL